MNHDVIEDRYARLFELPNLLGKISSLAVNAICLDYHLQKRTAPSEDLNGVWRRYNLPRTLCVGWLFSLMLHARKLKPQCVVASSDCLHVIFGWMLARCFNARFFVDLYDDYSTFGIARIPGIKWLYEHALQRAHGISAVSKTLAQYIELQYPGKPVLLLESTIDAARFYPRNKAQSRDLLGLNHVSSRKLVGVCGGLNAVHGADVVFESFAKVTEQMPEVTFVVAGTLYKECPLPDLPNVEYLGTLPHQNMPYFFSAMDVAVVALSNTRFGHFAFPQKAYEVLACEVPVVAANVGALSSIFEDLKDVLYDTDSAESLAATIVYQLHAQRIHRVVIPTWKNQAEALAEFITAE
jgi:glycosyltransferase involved in cell wall biosynthesis